MRSVSLLALLPTEALPLLLMAGGLAMIVGAGTIARTLFVLAAVIAFLPPILEPVLMLSPEWVLWLLIVFAWLSVFGAISALLLGKGASDQMVGSLAADFVKWIFFAPFRAFRWLFRALVR